MEEVEVLHAFVDEIVNDWVLFEVDKTIVGTTFELVPHTWEPVEITTVRTLLGKMDLAKIGSKKDQMEDVD